MKRFPISLLCAGVLAMTPFAQEMKSDSGKKVAPAAEPRQKKTLKIQNQQANIVLEQEKPKGEFSKVFGGGDEKDKGHQDDKAAAKIGSGRKIQSGKALGTEEEKGKKAKKQRVTESVRGPMFYEKLTPLEKSEKK